MPSLKSISEALAKSISWADKASGTLIIRSYEIAKNTYDRTKIRFAEAFGSLETANPKAPEPLDCPICGQSSDVYSIEYGKNEAWQIRRWQVRCPEAECQMSGPVREFRDDAVLVWNQWVGWNQPAVSDEVDAVVSMDRFVDLHKKKK